ncbi:MAG TPA: hypothetical protein VJ437_13450 [Acidiferrobacterales bacterium]|nr:hypothetical protein [Acidiferrobacterales bacterium]
MEAPHMNAVLARMRAVLSPERLMVLKKDLRACLHRLKSARDLSPARLRWMANLWLRGLGWPGIVGLSLVAFSLAFYVSAVLPAQEELERRLNEANSLRDRIQQAARIFTSNPRSPAGQLGAFYQFFPASEGAPETLRGIYQAAQAQGIFLDRGEYHVIPEQSGRLLRYQVTLPVKGPYPQIQKFLATVLTQNPTVSLENVSFGKQKVADPVVEARIQLIVYLRGET